MMREPNKNHGACRLRFPLKKHQITNLDKVHVTNLEVANLDNQANKKQTTAYWTTKMNGGDRYS